MPGNQTPKSFHLDKNASRLIEWGRAAGAPDDLLTTKQLAHWLGYAVGTLELMRIRGDGPRYIKLPGRVVYRRSDVIEWLLERQATSTINAPAWNRGRRRRKAQVNGAAAPEPNPQIDHHEVRHWIRRRPRSSPRRGAARGRTGTGPILLRLRLPLKPFAPSPSSPIASRAVRTRGAGRSRGGVRRSRALLADRPKLFDYQIDLKAKIDACQASGVELTQFEKKFLGDFLSFRRRSQGTWRIFWKVCRKCGVPQ